MKTKKLFVLSLLTFFLSYQAIEAKRVFERDALKVAQAIFPSISITGAANYIAFSQSDEPLYYVFESEKGYVIVAADDREYPVIGYSTEGNFDRKSKSLTFNALLSSIEERMSEKIESNSEPSEEIEKAWQSVTSTFRASKGHNAVSPLVKTLWDQSKPYNLLCPLLPNSSVTLTGCVATAMAQIMNYHRYPQFGFGVTPAYTTASRGLDIPAFDLSEIEFQWDLMKNTYKDSVSEESQNAVATLMYSCGVSVRMDYDWAIAGGSGAYSSDVPGALKQYFGYDATMQVYNRNYCTLEDWKNILYTEFDSGRPVYYSGLDKDGAGHAFICDGYDENGLFHFNWGWSGTGNGYFAIEAIDYFNNNFLITNIKPEEGGEPSYNNVVSASIQCNKYFVKRMSEIEVSGGFRNLGLGSFVGEWAFVLTDKEDNIINVLESNSVNWVSDAGAYFERKYTLPNNLSDGLYKIRGAVKSVDSSSYSLLKSGDNIKYEHFLLLGDNYSIEQIVDNKISAAAIKEMLFVDGLANSSFLYLFDLTGRLVLSSQVTDDKMTINVSQLKKGTYIIATDRGGRTKVVKP